MDAPGGGEFTVCMGEKQSTPDGIIFPPLFNHFLINWLLQISLVRLWVNMADCVACLVN